MTRLTELMKAFEALRASKYNGVEGVEVLDSGVSGPTLGITVNTHGNEPGGLAAYWFLTRICALYSRLLLGKVVFVLNNVRATEQYFSAVERGDRASADKARSSSEINFNRLPADVMKVSGNSNYELSRAQQLYGIWQSFDVGFDIHSTMQACEPMILLCDGGQHTDLLKGFQIEVVIRNIQNVQVGRPAASFYGSSASRCIAIEAGSHEDPQTFLCASECCLILMQNLGMLSGQAKSSGTKFREYNIRTSVLTTASTQLSQVFPPFASIKAGDVLATCDEGSVSADAEGHVLFCGKSTRPTRIGEEAFFVSDPVRLVTLD